MASHWKILIGLVLGVIAGLAVNRLWTAGTWAAIGVQDRAAFMAFADAPGNEPGAAAVAVRFAIKLNQFVGDLFIRLLRFAAVPIVVFSLAAGAAGLGDPRRLGRIGLRTVAIYLATTVFAVVLGIGIADAVGPGRFISPETRDALAASSSTEVATGAGQVSQIRGVWDQLLAVVPKNPFEALAAGDMLAVIFFSLAIGIGLALLPAERARPVIHGLGVLGDAVAVVVRLVMRIAPVAVFCLIAPVAAGFGLEILGALGVFCLSYLTGLALLLWVEYPLLVRSLGRMRPRDFLRGIAPAQLVAFTSSSSSATLPVTMSCATERLGVPRRIAGFVLPLGATINMDGTAMYQSMVTLFVAQAYGIPLGWGEQLSIVLAATLASIGSPGIPSGGIAMLIVILQSVGLPAEGIALILGVDRLLDMCRTVVNVSGDAMTAVVVARQEGAIGESSSGAAAIGE